MLCCDSLPLLPSCFLHTHCCSLPLNWCAQQVLGSHGSGQSEAAGAAATVVGAQCAAGPRHPHRSGVDGGGRESSSNTYGAGGDCGGISGRQPDTPHSKDAAAALLPVLRAVWPSALAMVINYCITLSIFPGVLAEDAESPVFGSWYPLLLISGFNVADLAGKVVPFCGFEPTQDTLLGAACARVVFIPGFLAAVRLFPGVAAVMGTLTLTLGFSNGLMTAMLMTLAPEFAPVGAAGRPEGVMVFSPVLGTTLGSAAGFSGLL